jgi:deoxyribodipyrimidine photo-lyase
MITDIFIFRNDLRIPDNTGFEAAVKAANASKTLVMSIFILNPKQIHPEQNEFASNAAIQFMAECLENLNQQLIDKGGKLYLLYGEPINVLESLIKVPEMQKLKRIWVNNDYTPYARKRDQEIKEWCQKANILFNSFEDRLLQNVGSVRPKSGSPVYLKFTPFFNSSSSLPVKPVSDFDLAKYPNTLASISLSPSASPSASPSDKTYTNFIWYNKIASANLCIKEIADLKMYYTYNPNIVRHGGRTEGMKVIDDLVDQENYEETRDFPNQKTTQLSAYVKFGTYSIRELYWHIFYTLGKESGLIKQLYWRDFYYNIVWITPDMAKSMKPKYDSLMWDNNIQLFEKWKTGLTGFPIIDAGMRELRITGYMHNRVRMATANFLVKLLSIDWRWGEKYFAQQLYDYDPAINNGNWQWVAGSGADAQPYFRIFNPWTQSENFDKDCSYIKKWCPELKDVPNYAIHKWSSYHKTFKTNYPAPIIDYEKARADSLELYKNL